VAHEFAQGGCVGGSPDEGQQRGRVEVRDRERTEGVAVDHRRGQDRHAEPLCREVGDGAGVRAQVVRRQADGTWLRLLDQPEVGPPVQP
jgi:hypothetical protein